jgi:hypothetical protein
MAVAVATVSSVTRCGRKRFSIMGKISPATIAAEAYARGMSQTAELGQRLLNVMAMRFQPEASSK